MSFSARRIIAMSVCTSCSWMGRRAYEAYRTLVAAGTGRRATNRPARLLPREIMSWPRTEAVSAALQDGSSADCERSF